MRRTAVSRPAFAIRRMFWRSVALRRWARPQLPSLVAIDPSTPLMLEPALERRLETQRAEYGHRGLVAMPLAGAIAWALVAAAGLVCDPFGAAMALIAPTGSIVCLGMALSRPTGENLLKTVAVDAVRLLVPERRWQALRRGGALAGSAGSAKITPAVLA